MLTRFISRLQNQEPDPQTERAVRLQIADALAGLALAAPTHEAGHLRAFHLDEASHGVSVAAAAAAIIRMSECDAIQIPSCLTPAIVVPVALSLAEDGTSLSRAIRASTAVGLWIAESIGGVRALERGVWPTLLAAPAMAATAAAVARNMDADEVANAVAIAISGTSGRLGRPMGTPSARWLAIGEATARGMRAARAARAGFRGDAALFGTKWLTEQSGGDLVDCELEPAAVERVGLKPFVAARQGMNALAAFDLLRDRVDWHDIAGIDVELPAECLPVVTRPLVMEDRLSRIANLPWRLAAGIIRRDDLFDPSAPVHEMEDVSALAARIKVTQGAFDAAASTWPARLRLKTADRDETVECLVCPGAAGDIDGQEAVIAAKTARLPAEQAKSLRRIQEAGTADAALVPGRECLELVFRSPAPSGSGAVASECVA